MDFNNFQEGCKQAVVNYVNNRLDKSDEVLINKDDVYVVWYAKTLGNAKALLSTNLSDGMYYELTYNGNTGDLYFDAYKKWENVTIPGKELF